MGVMVPQTIIFLKDLVGKKIKQQTGEQYIYCGVCAAGGIVLPFWQVCLLWLCCRQNGKSIVGALLIGVQRSNQFEALDWR